MQSTCGICNTTEDISIEDTHWQPVIYIVADDFDFNSNSGDWKEIICCPDCFGKIRSYEVIVDDGSINFRASDVKRATGFDTI
jgi:hypothetical protein